MVFPGIGDEVLPGIGEEALHGEGQGELALLLYSLIPSGYSWKSGQMTRDSWGRPGDLDLDLFLYFGLVNDLLHAAGDVEDDDEGLGSERVCVAGIGPITRSLCSSGLYIIYKYLCSQCLLAVPLCYLLDLYIKR